MKRTFLLLITTMTATTLAAQNKTPEAALGAALHQEEVQGDLNGAITAYQKLLAGRGLSHQLAAEALYHLGLCYQKLGDIKSRQSFERLVSEYGDTPWAARVKIADLRGAQPGRQTTTLVWSGPNADNEGSVSPDGRYISYPDWRTGNLAVHDFITGTDRAITTEGTWTRGNSAFAEESAIARDGKQIAYCWYEHKANRFDLRVANLTGDPKPRKIFESAEMRFIAPADWSPDGKWIAVNMEPENSDARTGQPARPGLKAALGLVGVQDGSVRVLKTMDWTAPSSGNWKILFSPDGKYVAYDWTTGSSNGQHGVFAMELASGREFPVVASTGNDQLAAWSPDGKQILFTSNRTGATGLWAIAFTGGAPQRQPELLKPDLGSSLVVGMTAAGALYYFQASSRDLAGMQVAGFDLATGKLTSQPVALAGDTSGEGSSSPAWSPDGKRLAYVSEKPAGSGSQFSIKIYAIDSGETRELQPGLGKLANMRWEKDGRSLVANEANALYRVNVQSGEASILVTRPKGAQQNSMELAPDGKTFYCIRQDGAESVFLAVDLASGTEREIIRRANLGGLNLSPDGRYLATPSIDPTDHARTFLVIPVDGGSPRVVIRIAGEPEAEAQKNFKEGRMTIWSWAPDSQSVLIRKRSGGPPDYELWQGFVDGAISRRVSAKAEPPLGRGGMRLSPDGGRVAFVVSGSSTTERAPARIMVLENFLPHAN
jgi:Tol biopolymer transport system component